MKPRELFEVALRVLGVWLFVMGAIYSTHLLYAIRSESFVGAALQVTVYVVGGAILLFGAAPLARATYRVRQS